MENYLNIALTFYKMRIKKITEVFGTKVYTDAGDFFGEVEEVKKCEVEVVKQNLKIHNTEVDYF